MLIYREGLSQLRWHRGRPHIRRRNSACQEKAIRFIPIFCVGWRLSDQTKFGPQISRTFAMAKGHIYLAAVVDWFSRRVLSWRLSTTMDSSFCVDALEDAIESYGTPEIFNTDQGSQFTSANFTDVLSEHSIKISMDGKGRWIDNVIVERLWRSVKYEEVYLKAYDTVRHARDSLRSYFGFYNSKRRQQSLDHQTPDEVYYPKAESIAA